MANSFTYAQKYLQDPNNLFQVYKAAAKTGVLESLVKFVPELANTVKIYHRELSSYTLDAYNRDSGTVKKDIVGSWKTYTLTQDKGNSLYLDILDAEEVAGDSIIAEANFYARTVIAPAVDTYRLGVLGAGSGNVVTTDPTVDNVVDLIKGLVAFQEDNEVPTSTKKWLFVTPAFKQLLETADKITHFINWREAGENINTKVAYFDNIEIISVPSSRFPTDTHAILVDETAIASCVRFNESKVLTGANLPGKFGYQIDLRLYYDLWVIDRASTATTTSYGIGSIVA